MNYYYSIIFVKKNSHNYIYISSSEQLFITVVLQLSAFFTLNHPIFPTIVVIKIRLRSILD